MQKYDFTIGRRKSAIATFRLYKNEGESLVNDRPIEKYFVEQKDVFHLQEPFVITKTLGKYHFTAKVTGGGKASQAGAIRLALARALAKEDEEFKKLLKKAGMLTRDDREKERKKTGLVKARKAPQFSKR